MSNKISADNIYLATIDDIAAMKLNAIIGRGSKKDFIDLFFILKDYSLATIMGFYTKKYNDGSAFLVLKSLIYFEDAEESEDPVSLKGQTWNSIKQYIRDQVRDYLK